MLIIDADHYSLGDVGMFQEHRFELCRRYLKGADSNKFLRISYILGSKYMNGKAGVRTFLLPIIYYFFVFSSQRQMSPVRKKPSASNESFVASGCWK